MGLQATGKSSFYKRNFFHSHMRVSYSMLRDEEAEAMFVFYCLEARQNFVIDNTNPTVESREKYIGVAKGDFEIIGYYFESKIRDAIKRNKKRSARERITEDYILRTYNKLQVPSYNEGFDKLYYVKIVDNKFRVTEWTKNKGTQHEQSQTDRRSKNDLQQGNILKAPESI